MTPESAPPVLRRLSREPDGSFARLRRYAATGGIDPDVCDFRPRMRLEDFARAEGLSVAHVRDLARRWKWKARVAEHDAAVETWIESQRFSSGRFVSLLDEAIKDLVSRDLSELKASEVAALIKVSSDQLQLARERENTRPLTLIGVEPEHIQKALSAPEQAMLQDFLKRIRAVQLAQA